MPATASRKGIFPKSLDIISFTGLISNSHILHNPSFPTCPTTHLAAIDVVTESPSMDSLDIQIDPLSLTGVPYDQKWDILKPAIERLYLRENRKLKDIVAAIRHQCGFSAVESQYKYQIKKWQLKKSTSTAKKAAVYNVVKSRAQLGKSSAITRNGQILETKNLRRYLKKEARKEMVLHPIPAQALETPHFLSSRVAQFGNRIFMNWNMPYGIMKATITEEVNQASPMSGIEVTTPPSPKDAPSPLTIAVKRMTAVERTQLFVEGNYSKFLEAMEKPQRLAMSTWLYHFWLYSFKTAKHWGRGPQTWTADILGLDKFPPAKPVVVSSPATSTSQNTPSSINMTDDAVSESMTVPNPLCRWSIHAHEVHYERIASPPHSPPVHIDLDDEESWPAWSASETDKDVTQKLNDGLERHTFTNVRPGELPIATDQIVRAVKRSPQEIHQEALGFSIMSRNSDLIVELLRKANKFGYEINGLYPFHLAIAYLDGSKICCNILAGLTHFVPLHRYYVNDLGHTVFDQLMIAILKSHTSCAPNVADSFFKNDKRFQGAEVDVCGRWDADSPCIRELLAKGDSSIPFGWKHMFCHTSVQVICHALTVIFEYKNSATNMPSGLFIRRCSHCGLKLQLLPLHALMMVGFYLSEAGCKGENLFGILACLLCLLSHGADPRLKANISLQSLWGEQDSDRCSHEEIDATELIENLVAIYNYTWSKEITVAWNVIVYVLRQSQAAWKGESSSDASVTTDELGNSMVYSDEDSDGDEEKIADVPFPAYCECAGAESNYFAQRRALATLWAAVKTELLTYRRLTEDDAWLSEYFDMVSLEQGLNQGNKVTIPLIKEGMVKRYCGCGNFEERVLGRPLTDEACAFYFSNMEDWNRTTFIEIFEN